MVMVTLVSPAGTSLEPDPSWVMFEQRAESGGPDVYRVQFDGTAAISVSPGGATCA